MDEKVFGTMPIGRLFAKLAIPGIVSMVFMSIGIMVDGIFVGQFMGSKALAAVNLLMPIVFVFVALGDMVAVGSSVKIAVKLGEGDEKGANRIFTASLLTVFSIGFAIALAGLFFGKSLLYTFIEDAELATLAYDYAKVFVLSIPLVMPYFAIDNYLRICGKINLSMRINIVVAISNIVLDAILIGVLGLGIEYAALATVAGQIIATLSILLLFAARRFTLKYTYPHISISEMLGIVYNGSSEFFSNIAGSLMAIVVNGMLLYLGGGIAVAAYAITLYINSLLVAMLYGIQDAMQPAVSYNYGAKKIHRVFKLYHWNCGVALSLSLLCMSAMLLFPETLVGMFANDADTEIQRVAKTALLLSAPAYLFIWYSMVASAFLTGLDRPKESLIITVFRAVLFPLASLLIMPYFMGLNGIFITAAVSAALTCTVAYLIWKKTMSTIKLQTCAS